MLLFQITHFRVLTFTRIFLFYRYCVSPKCSFLRGFKTCSPSIMSQRSIMSFFNKTPKKRSENNDGNKLSSPDKRSSKRQRLEISSNESNSPDQVTPENSPIKSDKKAKRQRIESSESEGSTSPTIRSHTEEKINVKTEKRETPPKTYGSTKPKKGKTKLEKSPLVEQNGADSRRRQTRSPSEDKEGVKNETIKSDKKVKTEDKVDEAEIVPVSEEEYNPSASKYDPARDACWARGQPVPYLALATTLHHIEATSARLKIVDTLANYFRSVMVLTPEDLVPSVYMCLNQLAPAYHSVELGVADTYLMKAIGQCTGRTLAQVRAAAQRTGDLGLVAEQARATQRTMFTPPPLTARAVYTALRDIATMTGQASVNKKIGKIQSLYVACRHSEARYLIRSLAGKLRIGLAEQSVLQALALAAALTPPAPPASPGQARVLDASRGLTAEQFKAIVDEHALIIKTTYCECPNYELVIPALLRHGVRALHDHCKLTPGVPLKPMLAHPTKGVSEVFNRFEGVSFTCEWKYDGERAQVHVPQGEGDAPDLQRAAVFSRNQENNTSKYPDIVGRLGGLLKESVSSCVLDCEAVAYDVANKQILPFQVLSTRRRKDAAQSEIKVQVCVFVFDLLYLNGRALVREPLLERRRLLHDHFNQVEGEWQFATSRDCSTIDEVQLFLEESVRGSCEGLMVKTLAGRDATYEIAKRSRNWLKLKKDYLEGVGDTLDVVVVGAYSGRGKRAGHYGGFLLACYDPDAEEYQSLCKIGTGFTDADLKTLSGTLQRHAIDGPRGYYRYDASHEPDAWFAPACVWEVRCADLSLSPAHRAALGLVDREKGISLRFPRFVRVREDKSPECATSAQQVADMYLSQDQVKNQLPPPAAAAAATHDDFY